MWRASRILGTSIGRASLIATVIASGCGDDGVSTTGNGTDSSTEGDTETRTGTDSSSQTGTITQTTSVSNSGSSSGDDGSSTGRGTSTTGSPTTSGTDSDTDSGTTTGGEVWPGQSHNQLVGVGQRMDSPNYSMVLSLGQPTQTQSIHSSVSYTMHGGLIGANGSPP